MRIVSLLGSATEIVFALGLRDLLVGISHECDHPPEVLRLPRVSRPRFDPRGLSAGEIDAAVRRSMVEHGSVYEVDVDLLAGLRPSLVIAQDVCEVCAVPTGSVSEAIAALDTPVQVLSLDAHTVSEILGTIRAVGAAAGRPDRGTELAHAIAARIDRVRERAALASSPRVLLLEWLDPLFAPGHWVPEMIEAAGGRCLIGKPGARSERIDPGDLAGLDPDVLLIEPCGHGIERALADAERHRALLESIAPRAIREGRVWALDSALFSRSGPRVVEGIELLARLFHEEHSLDLALTGASPWN